jgi:hypothetical protein
MNNIVFKITALVTRNILLQTITYIIVSLLCMLSFGWIFLSIYLGIEYLLHHNSYSGHEIGLIVLTNIPMIFICYLTFRLEKTIRDESIEIKNLN